MDDRTTFDSLVAYIEGHSPACVAFSGGVDSGVVALAAYKASPRDSLALTVSSELCAKSEVAEAQLVAGAIGIRHRVVTLDLLDIDGVAKNPPDRCYRCKTAIMRALGDIARKNSSAVLLDGTNADDAETDRPGLKALRELGVISPLMELGIGKAMVRRIAREQGLPNHGRPSSPCLATRFPYGVRLSRSRMRRVQLAEEYVRSLGFGELRVRDHGEVARLELLPEDIKKAITAGLDKKIVAKLTSLGYTYVTLDLRGFRSGSMDEGRGTNRAR